MKRYAPNNCMVYASEIKSVSDAMAKDSHSIGKIQREQSKNFTEGLTIVLANLSKRNTKS